MTPEHVCSTIYRCVDKTYKNLPKSFLNLQGFSQQDFNDYVSPKVTEIC